MITSKGDVKIIDLGSVSSLILQDNSSAPPGSLEYTAPEYYSGKPKGIYSDLFSLAIIAYEMLTNNKPFTSQQISHSKQQLSFNAPHILNNQLPVYLSSVFDRAFSIEPKTRYQALSEFISELDPINHKFKITTQPLLYRNPLLFWKSLSIILLVINIFLIFNLST